MEALRRVLNASFSAPIAAVRELLEVDAVGTIAGRRHRLRPH
jgi:hypothetical protein